MIDTSTCLMVTAGWLMPSTQDASHGAGHSRPVNSGKLLVACSRSIASSPLSAPDEVVPLRNEVAQRAALVAERDAAVHAAAGLALQDALFLGLVDLFPVHDADRNGTARLGFTLAYFQKSAWISHRSPPGFETKLLRRRGPGPLRWRRDGFAGPPRSRAAAPWLCGLRCRRSPRAAGRAAASSVSSTCFSSSPWTMSRSSASELAQLQLAGRPGPAC